MKCQLNVAEARVMAESVHYELIVVNAEAICFLHRRHDNGGVNSKALSRRINIDCQILPNEIEISIYHVSTSWSSEINDIISPHLPYLLMTTILKTYVSSMKYLLVASFHIISHHDILWVILMTLEFISMPLYKDISIDRARCWYGNSFYLVRRSGCWVLLRGHAGASISKWWFISSIESKFRLNEWKVYR